MTGVRSGERLRTGSRGRPAAGRRQAAIRGRHGHRTPAAGRPPPPRPRAARPDGAGGDPGSGSASRHGRPDTGRWQDPGTGQWQATGIGRMGWHPRRGPVAAAGCATAAAAWWPFGAAPGTARRAARAGHRRRGQCLRRDPARPGRRLPRVATATAGPEFTDGPLRVLRPGRHGHPRTGGHADAPANRLRHAAAQRAGDGTGHLAVCPRRRHLGRQRHHLQPGDRQGHRLVARVERGRPDHLLRPDQARAWTARTLGQAAGATELHDPLRHGRHVHERGRQRPRRACSRRCARQAPGSGRPWPSSRTSAPTARRWCWSATWARCPTVDTSLASVLLATMTAERQEPQDDGHRLVRHGVWATWPQRPGVEPGRQVDRVHLQRQGWRQGRRRLADRGHRCALQEEDAGPVAARATPTRRGHPMVDTSPRSG